MSKSISSIEPVNNSPFCNKVISSSDNEVTLWNTSSNATIFLVMLDKNILHY